MNPKLFRDDAVSFNNMGFGVLTHVISCEVTENLGEAPTLTIQMLDTDPLFQYVTVGNMIVCKPNKYDSQQAFVIEEITKSITDEVSIYATHIAQHRTKLIPVSPFTASNLNGAFSSMLSHSMESNPFTLVRDSGKTNVSAAMNVLNPTSFRELMGGVEGSIIDIYRGEWRYDNFTLTLYNKRGHDNGVRVMYRKNMTEFNLGENFSWEDSPTGAIGFWRKEETLVQSSIQYSAMASEFPYKKTVVVDFSDKYEDAPTVADLNTLTSQWINGKGSPSVGMEVAFNHLAFDGDKTIELGDTVHIINPNFNISTTRRIEGIVYNVLADEYISLTIGDQKPTINDAIGEMFNTETHKGVFPNVGDIICTYTNTNPSANYGGTWELIDKEFTPTTETNRSSSVSRNTTNCDAILVYTVHDGHQIQFWVQVKNKVAIANSTLTMATFTPANFGVSDFGDSHRLTEYSDAGDALIMWYLAKNGNFQTFDGWTLGTSLTHSVPAQQLDYINFNITLPMGSMLDSWCNKFYWRRTA